MDEKTFPSSSSALGIRLVGGPEQYYLPGNTIHGAVYREDHLVAPRARLKLSLQGPSKSHAADTANACNELYHTLEFKFFHDSDTTRVLYDGPAHIERGGSATWPFEMTIPLAASPVALARSGGQKSSYHPFSSEDPASLELPPSFDGEILACSTLDIRL